MFFRDIGKTTLCPDAMPPEPLVPIANPERVVPTRLDPKYCTFASKLMLI